MKNVTKFKIDTMKDKHVKFLFGIFYLIGSILIFSFVNSDQRYFPIISLTVTMFVYIFLVYFFNKQAKLYMRNEQIGDSFYYLGFLFTLTSLSATLLISDENVSIPALLSQFGIAIITTLIGLAGRIFLTQFRESTDELKEISELQVADTVRQLKIQLDMSIDSLKQQSEKISSQTENTFKESSLALRKFMEENNLILQETTKSTSKIITDFNVQANKITNNLKEINIPSDKFIEFENSVNNIVSSINNLQSQLSSNNLDEEIKKIAGGFESLNNSISKQNYLLNNDFQKAKDTLNQLTTSLVEVSRFIADKLRKK